MHIPSSDEKKAELHEKMSKHHFQKGQDNIYKLKNMKLPDTWKQLYNWKHPCLHTRPQGSRNLWDWQVRWHLQKAIGI